MVNDWGTYAFMIAAVAFIVFSFTYFVTITWWTDTLGLAIAGVLGPTTLILMVSCIRLFDIPVPGYWWMRAVLDSVFAIAMVCGVIIFIWSQFMAPRIRNRKDTR